MENSGWTEGEKRARPQCRADRGDSVLLLQGQELWFGQGATSVRWVEVVCFLSSLLKPFGILVFPRLHWAIVGKDPIVYHLKTLLQS